jgi:hypothetical protein
MNISKFDPKKLTYEELKTLSAQLQAEERRRWDEETSTMFKDAGKFSKIGDTIEIRKPYRFQQ